MEKYSPYISVARIDYELLDLANELNADYRDKEGVIILGVLNGAIHFVSDLTRKLNFQHELAFVKLSSYGNEQKSSGNVDVIKNWSGSLKGKHILILEDMLDTGLSMQTLLKTIEVDEPASVKIAALIYKKESTVKPNYHCFVIPQDIFIIGYGFDNQGGDRHLPNIMQLNK